MKTKITRLKRMTIDEFAVENGLVMEINERYTRDDPDRFCASFENSETSDGNILYGSYGNGGTPDEAVNNYADVISGKLLVIDASGDSRREIPVPELVKKGPSLPGSLDVERGGGELIVDRITTEQMLGLIDMEMVFAADGRDHEAMRTDMGFPAPEPGWYQQRWEVLKAIRAVIEEMDEWQPRD